MRRPNPKVVARRQIIIAEMEQRMREFATEFWYLPAPKMKLLREYILLKNPKSPMRLLKNKQLSRYRRDVCRMHYPPGTFSRPPVR